MTKKKPLKDLSLMNRFLFAEVMDNPEACQDMLSIILRKDIHLTSMPQTEKEHRVSPLIWSIRMDVFSISEEGTAYDVEAQDSWRDDLEKRSRYYQSLMDTSLLESGVDSYNELNDSYIIVITDYDIFGEGKYWYTFRARAASSTVALETSNSKIRSSIPKALKYSRTLSIDIIFTLLKKLFIFYI